MRPMFIISNRNRCLSAFVAISVAFADCSTATAARSASAAGQETADVTGPASPRMWLRPELTPDPRIFKRWPPGGSAFQEPQGQEPRQEPVEEEEDVQQVETEPDKGSGGKVAALLSIIGGVAGAVLAVMANKNKNAGTNSSSAQPQTQPLPRLTITPGIPSMRPPR